MQTSQVELRLRELRKLSSEKLVVHLKAKVSAEREALVDVLDCLKVVEEKRAYLEMGYSSLFAFATGELGYSESAALRRIDAMRLQKSLPEVREKIQDGKVNLSTLGKLQQFIRVKEKSTNEKLSVEVKAGLLTKIEGQSTRVTEKMFLTLAPDMLPATMEKERPLTEQFTKIEFVVDAEFMTMLERIRELHGHIDATATRSDLIKYVMKFYLDKKDPTLSKSKLDKKAPPTRRRDGEKRTRYIPVALKRDIYTRAHNQCTFTDPRTGRRCTSRHLLQVEHKIPYAQGGTHAPENLTLLCSAHNKLAAWKIYGSQKMRIYLPEWKAR